MNCEFTSEVCARTTHISAYITNVLSKHYLVPFLHSKNQPRPSQGSFFKTWRIQGNKRAIFCPLCCQFLYLIYIPSSFLRSLSCPQDKKGEKKTANKRNTECVSPLKQATSRHQLDNRCHGDTP